jgi:hypothetical protein
LDTLRNQLSTATIHIYVVSARFAGSTTTSSQQLTKVTHCATPHSKVLTTDRPITRGSEHQRAAHHHRRTIVRSRQWIHSNQRPNPHEHSQYICTHTPLPNKPISVCCPSLLADLQSNPQTDSMTPTILHFTSLHVQDRPYTRPHQVFQALLSRRIFKTKASKQKCRSVMCILWKPRSGAEVMNLQCFHEPLALPLLWSAPWQAPPGHPAPMEEEKNSTSSLPQRKERESPRRCKNYLHSNK